MPVSLIAKRSSASGPVGASHSTLTSTWPLAVNFTALPTRLIRI